MPQVRDLETERQSLTSKYRNWDEYESDSDSENETATDSFDPFKDLIQRDPCVCDHCFTRRYDEEAFEWSQGELGWMTFNNWIAVPERSTEIPADDGHGTRLACSNCGHKTTKHRPIPKDDIPEMTANLIRTLSEKGVDHDPDILRHEVHRRNTSHNQMRQDSDVFAPAIKAAIEAKQPDHPLVGNAQQNGLSAD